MSMKIRYIAAPLLMMGAMAFTGCVNDLDVFPLNPDVETANKAYSTPESYTMGLNKIYSVWALSGQEGPGLSDIVGLDPGNTVLLRCWFTLQTNTSDECINAWGDAWVSSINSLTWGTTQVEPIEGAYQRSMYIVALVNEFMKNIGNAPAEINQAQYAAEARFCRALAYYALMDLFARPPFITEENYSLAPSQLSRVDLFNWIEGELLAIHDALPVNPEYGRAGQAAVDALLSRMYLNAEVYTGTARYTDCITRCKKVMEAGYQLSEDYDVLFMADNGENPEARKEIIFPVMADGETAQSYGIGAIICGTRAVVPEKESGISGGWAGFRATANLVRTFDFENSNEDNWNADNIQDKRGIFYSTGKSMDVKDYTAFSTQGWSVFKFTNLNSDGTPGKNEAFPDTDFPLFRLGEIYLNYAEAVARGGEGGDMATAVGYINELRKRGFGNDEHAIDANWLKASAKVGGSNGSVQYGNLLNERMREMYFEAVRRTDLIRYGLFTPENYTWVQKGGVVTGVGVHSRYNIFPIPVTDLSVNGSLTQNEGY